MKHSKANVFMVAILSVAFFLSLSVHSAYGQWAATYGGLNGDYSSSIQQTQDGGYVVAGYTWSFGAGDEDAWIIKLDSAGAVTWQKAYGGANDDSANSIQQTADGGYIVAGDTSSFGAGGSDAWVMKLDSTGAVTWQKTYGDEGSQYFKHIQQTADGGYIAAGENRSSGAGSDDVWVMKLNATGGVTWQKTYGGIGNDWAHVVQQTEDGGYIVSGATYSFGAGDRDAWILKLNSTGAVTWQKTYGGGDEDYVTSIQQTADGGYIVAGLTQSFGTGDSDVWVLKLDNTGAITWQKTYGGVAGYKSADSIRQTQDGGYIVVGYNYYLFGDTSDVFALKLDSSGSIGSCPFEGVLSTALVSDVTAPGVDTTVVPADTAVTGVDSGATVSDTSVSANLWCPLTEDAKRLKVGITPKKKGEGTIQSAEGLIACPGTCQEEYNKGLTITLYADPSDLSTFLGWKPASLGCEGTDPCEVTLDKKKSVKAVFQGPNKLKVVTTFKKGGSGSVVSNDMFIDCPGDCEELYKIGTSVTLTATPGENSYFVKWTGWSCKDEQTNLCTFPMDKNETVKAIFQINPE